MISVNLRALPAACEGVAKTCYRCGRGYTDYTDTCRMRVCPRCKKPVNPPKDLPSMHGKPLTHRETQIVDLLATGMLNKQIAHDSIWK